MRDLLQMIKYQNSVDPSCVICTFRAGFLSDGSCNSTFLSGQDSILLHLHYGDSFTELVDDLLALMSYIL